MAEGAAAHSIARNDSRHLVRRDPGRGSCLQSGPPGQWVHSGFRGGHGSQVGDAGSGDDREDPSRVFRSEEANQGDLPRVSGVPEGRAQGDPVNIVLIDRGPVVLSKCSLGSIHPPPAPIGDGERINLFRALAIWRTGRQGRPRSHPFADEEVLSCAISAMRRPWPDFDKRPEAGDCRPDIHLRFQLP